MSEIWNKPCIFTPSLISCCDLCNLEQSVREIEQSGIEMLHVDILDGYFSPSMPLGLDTVRQLRKKTDLFFDCHVMAKDPSFFIHELLDIGVEQIVFHAETEPHIDGMINQIHAAGAKAGIALKPSTPLSTVEYVLEKCDTVLLMLINPGYAFLKNETQINYAAKKIHDLRKMITDAGLQTKIEIDGRISVDNLKQYAPNNDVDLFVIGSTCVRKGHLQEDFAALQTLRTELLGGENA